VSYSNTVLRRYQYEAEGLVNGECGLRISEINEDEDVGKWTCMARLQGRKEEGQDYITVKTDGMLKASQLQDTNQSNKQSTNRRKVQIKSILNYMSESVLSRCFQTPKATPNMQGLCSMQYYDA
jgi:hypothetical protein